MLDIYDLNERNTLDEVFFLYIMLILVFTFEFATAVNTYIHTYVVGWKYEIQAKMIST